MIGERMASKAMINKTMIDRIEMKQKLMQWRSALVLVTMLLMLPLQMLAAELGEAGKRLAALPGVSDVEALESTTFPEKYVFFIKQQLDGKDASKGTFEQRVVLCHRGFDRPTVLVTEGYSARYALYKGYIEELAKTVRHQYHLCGVSLLRKVDAEPLQLGLSDGGELAL